MTNLPALASADMTRCSSSDGKCRKRLRPLLQKLLNEGSVPQLCWLNKDAQIWKMPWKHHKQTRWGDSDAFMLRELARSLYGYQGPDQPAPESLRHWKELVRNALRSLKDVKELEEQHNKDDDEPFKVYQFLDDDASRGNRVRRSRRSFGHQNGADAQASSNSSHVSFNGCLEHFDIVELGKCLGSGGSLLTTNEAIAVTSVQACIPLHLQSSSAENLLIPQSSRGSQSCSLLDGLSDQVNEHVLNEKLSEFNLLDLTNLPSFTTTDRSRSPLTTIEEAARENVYGSNRSYIDKGDNYIQYTMASDVTYDKLATLTVSPAVRDGFCETPLSEPLNVNDDVCKVEGFMPSIGRECFVNRGLLPIYESESNDLRRGPGALSEIMQPDQLNLFMNPPRESLPSLTQFLDSAPPTSLVLAVYYSRRHPVTCRILSGTVRVCYVPDAETRQLLLNCSDPRLFGPPGVQMIELPRAVPEQMPLWKRPKSNDINAQKVLETFTRGLILEVTDDCILATRYCKTSLFFLTAGRGHFQKLERYNKVQLFDRHQDLEPHSRGQPGRPHVQLSLGVQVPGSTQHAFITLELWHVRAHRLAEQEAENSGSIEVMISLDDEHDQKVDRETQVQRVKSQPLCLEPFAGLLDGFLFI